MIDVSWLPMGCCRPSASNSQFSHAGDRGSIPLGDAKLFEHLRESVRQGYGNSVVQASAALKRKRAPSTAQRGLLIGLPLVRSLPSSNSSVPPASSADAPVRQAGVPRYSWRRLRHYAVGAWLASGIDPKTAQHWAGHSTLTLMLDTCGHMIPRPDHHQRIAAAERALLATWLQHGSWFQRTPAVLLCANATSWWRHSPVG
jgi:hypothetical protein